MNIFLFIAVVFIWGTTWIAIAFQIGDVAILVSVFYRFLLGGLIMLAALFLIGRLKKPTTWRFVFLQALCLYCFNFICFYQATALIPSGLAAVIFSMASLFNAFNSRIFFNESINLKTALAGLIGIVGIIVLFWRDIVVTPDIATLTGIIWATIGTMLFSLGNMISRKNTSLGIGPTTATAWGMGIGAAVLLVLIGLSGTPITISEKPIYWAALLYLAVPGSIIAFTTYLTLVSRIGAVRAGYATVLFPLVALLISVFFEGYQWHWTTTLGMCLTMLGNVVMFAKIPKRQLAK